MNHPTAYRIVLLPAALLALSLCAPLNAAEASPPTEEQILGWVVDLDSDVFVQRERATERLIENGISSIDPLVRALAANNLEVTTRGIHILRELALASDSKTAEAACAALEKIARPKVTSAARRAAAALNQLDVVRHERALADLKRLGAEFGSRQTQVGFEIINRITIEIGEKWRGNVRDLDRLQWLQDIDEVTLSNPELDDASLAHVATMKSLSGLTISKANITDAGLRVLSQLDGLQTLSVLYSPIGDAAVDRIATFKELSTVRLFGTKLTTAGKTRLEQVLPAAKIDVRRGAFLGIGCDPTLPGCVIYIVRPDTAAQKAGLMIGDRILEFDGQQVIDFEQLTSLIGKKGPGETINLKIQRRDQELAKKIKLGNWERLD